MANNRLYLCCIKCINNPDKDVSECIFFMFKYYPNTGWYINIDNTDERKIKWIDDTTKFLDQHHHDGEFDSWEEGMYGRFISIFEHQFDVMAMEKERIIDILKAGFDKLHNN